MIALNGLSQSKGHLRDSISSHGELRVFYQKSVFVCLETSKEFYYASQYFLKTNLKL